MQFAADLHLHSRYSRAVSPQMNLPVMATFARQKGIDILSACDWTHPLWFREIKSQLEETEEGLYKLKSEAQNPKSETNPNDQNIKVQKGPIFLLSTEISSIYTQGGKLRRIHNLLLAPSFEIADKINAKLTHHGANLRSDGRPIIGLSSKELLELVLSVDPRVILIPCHIWTPHFGIYGSASGFDSIEECFGNLSKFVYGIETGISSDPEMNWQISELDNRSILSFSDAHSPAKMGRELTVFSIPKTLQTLSYMDIGKAISRPMKESLGGLADPDYQIYHTIEFYPEEGKYHYSGHRNCHVSQTPEETKKNNFLCPACGKRVTEGVLYRVEQLAKTASYLEKNVNPDEHGVAWIADAKKKRPKFVKLVPLLEIIAESMQSSVMSEKVKSEYRRICGNFGSELSVLLGTPVEEIASFAGARLAEGVRKVRGGDISIAPGYDGEYGKVSIWKEEAAKIEEKKQASFL